MKVSEKSRHDIEAKLSGMSDFIKIDYLESALKSNIDIEAKKFCHSKLIELYDDKKMFSEAAKNSAILSNFAITFKDQINSHMKSAELWVKAGQYERADESFRKALASGNTKEREEMKRQIKELYKAQARVFEKSMKNSNAAKIYEKLLELSMQNPAESEQIKNKLLEIYKKLGKIREYNIMKNQFSNQPINQQKNLPILPLHSSPSLNPNHPPKPDKFEKMRPSKGDADRLIEDL